MNANNMIIHPQSFIEAHHLAFDILDKNLPEIHGITDVRYYAAYQSMTIWYFGHEFKLEFVRDIAYIKHWTRRIPGPSTLSLILIMSDIIFTESGIKALCEEMLMRVKIRILAEIVET